MLKLMRWGFMLVMATTLSVNLSMAEEPALSNKSVQESFNQTLDVLDLKNMDVLDVFKLISQKSGINIVASQEVKGKITVYLKNIKVKEALHIIVEANGWAFVQDNDIIKIMSGQEFQTKYSYKFGQEVETRIKPLSHAHTAEVVPLLAQIKSVNGKIISDDKSNTLILIEEPRILDQMEEFLKRVDVPIKTEVFALHYAKAKELSEKIAEALTPNIGKMRYDERSNRIVVSDTQQKINQIVKIIEAFDQKDREVLIEAKIIQIVLSDEHKFGVDWEAIVRDYHDIDFVSDFDILALTDKKGKVSIGTLSQHQYTAAIEALNTVGVTDILSSPRITTLNEKEAKILVGSTEPYVTSTTTTPSSGPTTTAENVNFIEVGVKLYVTPTIHPDNYITMKIKPEVSSVTKTITTSTNNTIPVVETSEAETTVTVKDGVTIVIGGLIKEEKLKKTKKVPFLGSIPLVGFVFRNEDETIKKTEIAIFLTPRIITGDIPQEDSLSTSSFFEN